MRKEISKTRNVGCHRTSHFESNNFISKVNLLFFVIFGSGALRGKMLLARIIENNIIDAYFS